MEADLLSQLDALQPLLKQHWAARLRRAPAARPGGGLITPDMLVLMIDSTLKQLMAGLGAPLVTDWPARRFARFSTAKAGCQCGLDLLFTYYVSGTWAFHEVMRVTIGPVRRWVLRHFTRLARQEVRALCGVCLHNGGTFCRWRKEIDRVLRTDAPSA